MKIILITILIGFLLFDKQSFGCDCPKYSLKQVIPSTEIILTGKFILVENNEWPLLEGEKEEDRLYYEGKIVITEVLVGSGFSVGDTIPVNSDYSNCSKFYKNNKTYMFFASRIDEGIISDACSFTHQLDDRTKDKWYLETIEELKKK